MKHKNTSKWARRALKRGINVMDDGTRDAIAEQLRLGQELRQKVCATSNPYPNDAASWQALYYGSQYRNRQCGAHQVLISASRCKYRALTCSSAVTGRQGR